jgi:hypothetical protein
MIHKKTRHGIPYGFILDIQCKCLRHSKHFASHNKCMQYSHNIAIYNIFPQNSTVCERYLLASESWCTARTSRAHRKAGDRAPIVCSFNECVNKWSLLWALQFGVSAVCYFRTPDLEQTMCVFGLNFITLWPISVWIGEIFFLFNCHDKHWVFWISQGKFLNQASCESIRILWSKRETYSTDTKLYMRTKD